MFAGDDFVTSDTGTGFVHIAPGHGLEDYNLGRQNGLPIYSPVDDNGCFAYTDDLPREQQMPAEMIGKSILEKHGKSDANEAVLHELRLRHALLHQENYHHTLPVLLAQQDRHIFRAMDQWFIKMIRDDDLRSKPDSQNFFGLRTRAGAPSHRCQLDSGLGREPHQKRGGIPAGLVHLAPTDVGRAHPGVL